MEKVEDLIETLKVGKDLSADQCFAAASILASPETDLSSKRSFLVLLSEKGESPTEVASIASAFREMAVNPGVEEWAGEAIDVCGTGGDGSSTFNISTAVSFLVAAAGVPVFKHGNRSITSQCGSADLMEALGIRLDAPVEMIHKSLRELNFCFFFAPAYHPAFKEIVPVRKALAEEGRRSVFNLLGPLINPGKPAHQLMGVFAQRWVQPVSRALSEIGLKSGVVAHCTPGPNLALDELSCAGENFVSGFGLLEGIPQSLAPSSVNLKACQPEDLKGGDVSINKAILAALFAPESSSIPSGLVDTVLLNVGVAFWSAGRVASAQEGVELGRDVIRSGRAQSWLSAAKEFYSSFDAS